MLIQIYSTKISKILTIQKHFWFDLYADIRANSLENCRQRVILL